MVMDILNQLTNHIEVYSIDEAFAEVSSNVIGDLTEYGHLIKKTIYQWTGLPVSVGIAPSKTLAKIANHVAKKHAECSGVLYFSSPSKSDSFLGLESNLSNASLN